MATFDNSYSRVVVWLKIVLPLIALAILSTLFLVSRSVEPVATLGENANSGTDSNVQTIDKLLYSGVTNSGSAVTLRAGNAKTLPGKSQNIELQQIVSRFEFADGHYVTMVANDGILDGASNSGLLRTDVVISTSSGYRVETNSILAEFNFARIVAKTSVWASGPLGNIRAGSMVMQQQSNEGFVDSYELVFKNGVHLIYDPNKNRK